MSMKDAGVAVSLFSGAGGLDLGAELAGFSVVGMIEASSVAAETVGENRDHFFPTLRDFRVQDIRDVSPREWLRSLRLRRSEVKLLVGGPPCVPFSKSGNSHKYKTQGLDPRASLMWEFTRFLDDIRPSAFVMENADGLAYKNHSARTLGRFLKETRDLGYEVQHGVLNAAEYGVPQARRRLFVVGRRGTRVGLRLPSPTHGGDRQPTTAAADALAGLPSSPEDEDLIAGKYGHLVPAIPPGDNYLFYTARRGYPNPKFEWRSRFWSFLLKLDPERPSPTLVAQPGPYVGPFHWNNRRLRTPEVRRLQGFPDDYRLPESRRDSRLLLGNAVPPLLAQSVVAELA